MLYQITHLKLLFWGILFLSISLQAQDYVDLLRIGYGKTLGNTFENNLGETKVTTFEADATLPLPLSEKLVLITGGIFGYNSLDLYPNTESTSLFSTALKLGLASTFNDRWSSTLVLLPKVASDYKNITADDFYLGFFGSLKYRRSEHFTYRFGVYASQEAFGAFTTPIFGWYYFSPSKRFEMDVSLPISVDINYRLGKLTVGMDYFGIGRSFNLTGAEDPEVYVDLSSLEFAAYVQTKFINTNLLLRGKIGYSSNDFEVYAQGDKIDLGLSAFSFGNDRTQLNPDLGGGIFLKFEVLYRFQLPNNENEKKIID